MRFLRVAVYHSEPELEAEIVSGGLFDNDAVTKRVPGTLAQSQRSEYLTILQIRVRDDSSKVVLRSARSSYAPRTAVIQIEPYEISPELERGIKYWREADRPKAEVELRKAIAQGSDESRSRARRQLAKFLLEDTGLRLDRLREVAQLHQEAADLARKHGQLSDEAWNLLNEADVRRKYMGQSAKAESILGMPRLQQLRKQLPGLATWIPLYHGAVFANADPYRALTAVEEGLRAAALYQDNMAGEQLCRQRSLLLYTLGRVAEARKPCDGGASVSHCWDAHNLLAKAEIQLMEMSLTHHQDADPRPDLQQVNELLDAGCKSANKRTMAKIYRARAQLLADEHDQMSDDDLASGSPPQDPELIAELLSIRGELALGRTEQDLPAARKFFDELRVFAEKKGLHAHSWLALTKLAQSYEQEDAQKAEALYQEATRLLEQWAEQMPIGLGHGSFLGRHEDGVRHYVDFLLRNKKHGQALEVIRRTRVLGLLALLLTRTVEDLSAAARESLLRVRMQFEEARLQGDELGMQQRREALLKQLSEVIGAPNVFSLPKPPPLQEDEALFTCYPVFPESRSGSLSSDWACFAARGSGEPFVQRVGPLDPGQPHGRLSRQILMPFMDVLATARVIRVLEYGLFSQVPMHLLPLTTSVATYNQPLLRLGDQHQVVYALDLPDAVRASQQKPPQRRGSLVILNPDKEHPELERCSKEIAAATAMLGGPMQSLPLDPPVQTLLSKLEQTSFLHYAGHAVLDHGSYVYGLSLSKTETLSASRLLHLSPAPEHAVLLGCGTGGTHDEYGDGVALGVAQALLLRGTREVIAATRVVQAATAAEVECYLYKYLSTHRTEPYLLASALQHTVVEPKIAALGQLEQGAFRAYVY
jgi:hypothetical protein